VRFYGADWTLSCRGKLDEFKARLPDSFVQTHNRYLVNLARAAALTPQAIRLDNGDEAPISRAFKDSASAAYFDHVSVKAARE
jgi:DNA-binding LytR/AlgR family response regulator